MGNRTFRSWFCTLRTLSALFPLLISGCLPAPNESSNPVISSQTNTRLNNVMQFINAREANANYFTIQIEYDAEAVKEFNGGNADSARSWWRQARDQYEQMRFAAEKFTPTLHQQIATWFTSNPTEGFHCMEKILFPQCTDMIPCDYLGEVLQAGLADIPGAIQSIISGSGVFAGFEMMLADIDTIKFSGLDSAYSNNSYNDILSNYTGLDSVYSYYQSTVRQMSPATDSLFVTLLLRARNAVLTAGSMAAIDKPNYRIQYLYPLEDAVKKAAQIVAAQL